MVGGFLRKRIKAAYENVIQKSMFFLRPGYGFDSGGKIYGITGRGNIVLADANRTLGKIARISQKLSLICFCLSRNSEGSGLFPRAMALSFPLVRPSLRHLGTKCLFTTHSVFDRMTGLITPMHFPGDGNLGNVLMNTFSGCNTRTLVGRDGK